MGVPVNTHSSAGQAAQLHAVRPLRRREARPARDRRGRCSRGHSRGTLRVLYSGTPRGPAWQGRFRWMPTPSLSLCSVGVSVVLVVFFGFLFVRCLARLVVRLCVDPVGCVVRALGPRRSRTNKEPRGPHRYRHPRGLRTHKRTKQTYPCLFNNRARIVITRGLIGSCRYCDHRYLVLRFVP